MKLTKSRRKSFIHDEVAKKIAKSITRRQHQIADYLNQQINSFSRRTLIIALIGFCTVSGSFLIYLLINALN